ncbi:hypothetical protein NMY22_g18850 [Coprinellus aureogranulatus]|nr:hypothetical protein NMY22_g18850 [Coprinellus aureogranulatus]
MSHSTESRYVRPTSPVGPRTSLRRRSSQAKSCLSDTQEQESHPAGKECRSLSLHPDDTIVVEYIEAALKLSIEEPHEEEEHSVAVKEPSTDNVAPATQASDPPASDLSEAWKVLADYAAPSPIDDAPHSATHTLRPDLLIPFPNCDRDTQEGMVEDIMDWLTNRDTPTRVLCLTGAAGTGKTALRKIVEGECTRKGILASSFTFSRSDTLRNSVKRLVPSIAFQLGSRDVRLRELIAAKVKDDPLVFRKSVTHQVETLILEPMKRLRDQDGSALDQFPHVVLIDAVDECKLVHAVPHPRHQPPRAGHPRGFGTMGIAPRAGIPDAIRE